MGMEEGETVISAEKEATAPMIPKPEAEAEDSSIAPSQFNVSLVTTPNH